MELTQASYPKLTSHEDFCDDGIEMILNFLEWEDLLNIADTCTRLRNIARSVFSRKYQHYVFVIDTFNECEIELQPFQHKPVAMIVNAKVYLKLLRNFGESVKYLCVYFVPFMKWRSLFSYAEYCPIPYVEMRLPTPYKYVSSYVMQYCADSLEGLHLNNFPLTCCKSFSRLKYLSCLGSRIVGEGMLPPILSTLRTEYPPTRIFPNLEIVSVVLCDQQQNDLFVSFLKFNPQIKSLTVVSKCADENCNDDELVISSINKFLPKLKYLNILFDLRITSPSPFCLFDDPRLLTPLTQNYRFKTIEEFEFQCITPSIRGLANVAVRLYFDDLKKLTLGYFDENAMNWNETEMEILSEIIFRNKKLKSLTFVSPSIRRSSTTIEIVRKLLSELLELEEICIHGVSKETDKMLREILGSEWIITRFEAMLSYTLQVRLNIDIVTYRRKGPSVNPVLFEGGMGVMTQRGRVCHKV